MKNEVYLGTKTLTRQKTESIKKFHLEVIRIEKERLFHEVTKRFKTRYLSEGPIVSPPMDCVVTWNLERNLPGIPFELGMQKLQEEVRKYVISMRFERIQRSLKFFQEYQQKEEKMGRKFKIAEYVDLHSQRLK